ncbi:MAG: 16S rRNA (guanine(527)-N(7))-methyltransferase RsmG [Boseongicola sp. SB0664_bin_43]|uniref:Ribosomal RNA small subunit methyltransferase G n=1 Tax=Boseongicola sp. SB0664_bin_43 TaxID=2604844 RepID=A0A6B0Y3W6_9RHOB|nr:16S rRNA (guanine(527)-N(7))-methyltransferase RsmG [Boseongicola sp. SB0664_bin_43]MYK32228.1 16S rRNA (guanine(527)-N(7))-methyltransferase RsmG [Boseongicola sp. SB0670_bin_30]
MTGKAEFCARTNVSRETLAMLETHAELLKSWNPHINLVSAGTMETLWTRHFLDSAQLLRLAPPARRWVDLGSGGGFPGAVVAIMAKDKTETVLIEADGRKAAFLRTLSRETAGFTVITARLENAEPQCGDVVSARALAPLGTLLGHVRRHLKPDGRAILPKGKKVQREIRQALEHWRFDCETYPSETDEEAVILSIGGIRRA